MFFYKANGKWHAHGRLAVPRPACEAKKHLIGRLPECCRHIEVFPKSPRGKVAAGQWYNANFIRMPFGLGMNYETVGELRRIEPDPVDAIPTYEQIDEEHERRPAPATTNGTHAGDLPLEGRKASVRRYCEPIGMVGEGHRHNATVKVAACALKDNCLPKEVAWELLREFNANQCSPPLDDNDLRRQLDCGEEYGWHQPRIISATPAADEEPARPFYQRPRADDVKSAIVGTAMETYLYEVKKISSCLPTEMVLSDAIQLGAMLLSMRQVSIGKGVGDFMPLHMNMYAMKLGNKRCGKGTTSRVLLHVAKLMGVQELKGESEAAIAECASLGANSGLYYTDEVGKILDPENAVSRQIVTALASGWDRGKISWVIRPRGKLDKKTVPDFYPSALLDGQPSVLEQCFGKSLIQAGFLARFLISTTPEPKRIKKVSFPGRGCDPKGILRLRGCPSGQDGRGTEPRPGLRRKSIPATHDARRDWCVGPADRNVVPEDGAGA